jgi:hypothetical protein
MENKEVKMFWFLIATAFLWIGILTDTTEIFSTIAVCLILVGNIRSRKLQ